jgi:hypothetical protein
VEFDLTTPQVLLFLENKFDFEFLETRVGRREKTKTSLEERGAKRRRDG